jgi:transposase
MKENELSMKIIHPYAAGIDIGSKTHWVAVDQVPANVKEFGVYTRDHQRLIEHLKSHQIATVAMESTGSYWQTLFHALQKAGFKVILVQGSQTRNVQGKKTDILDCMWIQKLHSLGLLSSSFLLSDYLQTLRTYHAILAGKRDPDYLASLAHFRVKKTPQEIAAALHCWLWKIKCLKTQSVNSLTEILPLSMSGSWLLLI